MRHLVSHNPLRERSVDRSARIVHKRSHSRLCGYSAPQDLSHQTLSFERECQHGQQGWNLLALFLCYIRGELYWSVLTRPLNYAIPVVSFHVQNNQALRRLRVLVKSKARIEITGVLRPRKTWSQSLWDCSNHLWCFRNGRDVSVRVIG